MQLTENKLHNNTSLSKVFVQSGEIYISKIDEIIWTVLGSCITVLFYSVKKKITIFSHAQLPSENFLNNACLESCVIPCYLEEKDKKFKYVTCSINFMIEQLAKFQISKNEITTYLIGGSSSFNITIGKSKNVAERNVETAQAMLKKNNIRYTEYVNGTMSRKVQFNTKNGELLINED